MKKSNVEKWIAENIVEQGTNSKMFVKTPDEYRREVEDNLQLLILEEQNKQDNIIKQNKEKTGLGLIIRALFESDDNYSNEATVLFIILAIEIFLIYMFHDNFSLFISIIAAIPIPAIYIRFNLKPVLDMDRVAREEIKLAREKKLNAREICEKRVKETCETYEKRYNEWIEAMKSSDKRLFIIYADHNQIGDIINDSSKNTTHIDNSTHSFNIDTRKIDTDALVNKICSNEEGLKELIKQIDSIEQGIRDLSSTLGKGKTRTQKAKEMLGDVANVATVIQALTAIANIPELAAYANEIMEMIF